MNKIDIIYSDKPDNVFLCVGSPEERCIGSVSKLDNDYQVNQVILIRYSDKHDTKREENINFIKTRFSLLNCPVNEFKVDEEKPIPIIQKIIDIILLEKKRSEEVKIVIDFSTMIKWHFLILLNALSLNNLLKHVKFVYTEPKEYETDLFQPLSYGLKSLFPIPTYYGSYDYSKETLLILFLGYEGDRAFSILEKTDPSDCILLIGKPAYHSEWEGRTEELNIEVINTIGSQKVMYIDSRNPLMICTQLDKIISRYIDGFNIFIAPLGTKPQVLGLFYYLEQNQSSNITLVYSSPLRHNHLFYSTGIGPTWELPNIFN